MTLGQALFSYRSAKNVSQDEVSSFLGVSRQTYNGWELDRTKPSTERIDMICLNLELTYDNDTKEWGSPYPIVENPKVKQKSTPSNSQNDDSDLIIGPLAFMLTACGFDSFFVANSLGLNKKILDIIVKGYFLSMYFSMLAFLKNMYSKGISKDFIIEHDLMNPSVLSQYNEIMQENSICNMLLDITYKHQKRDITPTLDDFNVDVLREDGFSENFCAKFEHYQKMNSVSSKVKALSDAAKSLSGEDYSTLSKVITSLTHGIQTGHVDLNSILNQCNAG